MKRATKGGEFGANGEWYDGGRFLNTVPENAKKEGSSRRKARKVEIEPYKWVEAVEGKRSIYAALAGIYGKVIGGVMVLSINPVTLAYYGNDEATVRGMADRYNAGERWM
jgi:hypothetical protein